MAAAELVFQRWNNPGEQHFSLKLSAHTRMVRQINTVLAALLCQACDGAKRQAGTQDRPGLRLPAKPHLNKPWQSQAPGSCA